MHTVSLPKPDEDEPPQIGLKVGNLMSTLSGVAFAPPEGTVEQAITQMQIDDFSQLAVMTANKRKLIGAITWKSIAIARHNNVDATLRDRLIDAPEISYDQELVDVLGVLQSVGFGIKSFDQLTMGDYERTLQNRTSRASPFPGGVGWTTSLDNVTDVKSSRR